MKIISYSKSKKIKLMLFFKTKSDVGNLYRPFKVMIKDRNVKINKKNLIQYIKNIKVEIVKHSSLVIFFGYV